MCRAAQPDARLVQDCAVSGIEILEAYGERGERSGGKGFQSGAPLYEYLDLVTVWRQVLAFFLLCPLSEHATAPTCLCMACAA